MKKTFLFFGTLAFLLLTSCASFPSPSDKTPSILIIDRELDRRSSDLSLYVSYYLVLDNGEEHLVSLLPSDKYLIVEDLPPGNYSVKKMISVNKRTHHQSSDPLNLETQIILLEGKITVFPYTFKVVMEKTGSYSYMQVWGLDNLSAKDMSALLKDIEEMYPKDAALWEPLKSGSY